MIKESFILPFFTFLGILISCLLLFMIFFILMSPGKVKNTEKLFFEINGAKNGFFIQKTNPNNPVLLFVSSGPGTEDFFLTEKYKNMNLSDYFTVCYWSYRGMGLAYDKSISSESITTEILNKDTLAVTQFLKEYFNQDKIYIMGFSGGCHLAIQAVKQHPENYHAYFAISQVVAHGPEMDTLMYQFMKEVFIERKDTKHLESLEKSVNHLSSDEVICNDWFEYVNLLHLSGGGTIKDKSEIEGIVIPIMTAKCYTVLEKINYIKGMKMYRKTPFYMDCEKVDYRKEIISLNIPVYFISGESDFNCPWPMVEQYEKLIAAPDKDFLLVKNAAHSPLWENPEVVIDFMRSKIN
jgi:pimeloyl-ACP methyl ester carboxylesterase